jgi:hypothetical protein
VIEVSPTGPEPASVLEVTASKYDVKAEPPSAPSAPAPAIPDEDLGLLPQGYAEDRLVLVPRDPEWVFIYWELNDTTFRAARERVPDGTPVLRLRVESGGAEVVRDVEVGSASNGRYYARALGDDLVMSAELGLRGSGGTFAPMVRSFKTRVPRSRPAPSEPLFITVPFDVPLHTLRERGHVAGGSFVSAQGRLLSEAEYRRLFGSGWPGSKPRGS